MDPPPSLPRRVPRDAAVAAAAALVAVAAGGFFFAGHIAQASTLHSLALGFLPAGLAAALAAGVWRGGRFALRADDAALLTLPRGEHGPLRPHPPAPARALWLGAALAAAVFYAGAVEALVPSAPSRRVPYRYGEKTVLTAVISEPSPLKPPLAAFWALLVLSGMSGAAAFCLWLDQVSED